MNYSTPFLFFLHLSRSVPATVSNATTKATPQIEKTASRMSCIKSWTRMSGCSKYWGRPLSTPSALYLIRKA